MQRANALAKGTAVFHGVDHGQGSHGTAAKPTDNAAHAHWQDPLFTPRKTALAKANRDLNP